MAAATSRTCLVQCLTPLCLRLLQCACLAPLISLGCLLQLSCTLSRLEEAACRRGRCCCSSPGSCLEATHAACCFRRSLATWSNRPEQPTA